MDVACDGQVPENYGEHKPQFTTPEQVLNGTSSARITTSCGVIDIELLTADAPETANNFAFLAGKHFYDATIVHRVVPGFVIQMGDPTGTGSGGPGYRFADELGAAQQYG
jgi:cyclophilin family peptidyl-prolyl cis-trans isomerase